MGLGIALDCTMHCVSKSVGEICYNVHLAELWLKAEEQLSADRHHD